MGRVLTISLSEAQLQELETGYKTGSSHAFRQRCRMIVLKSQGRKTKEICEIVEINSQNQVNKWIKRYKSSYLRLGIAVLHNAEGQGRKTVFDAVTQQKRVKEVVQQERQKLSNAHTILENEMNKKFHIKTLKNFLKALAADTNDLDVL
jgi:putative transposase